MTPKRPPSESDLGSKVSIRLHELSGGFRDLLGVLVTTTSVRKKDGSVVSFEPDEIAIWKVVPSETTMKRRP
mgnify:FL=1